MGQALRLAERKDVDAVLVHAHDLEGEALARGRIAQGLCLEGNHFLLAGPEEDPARVREAREVLEALRRIARAQAPFVSRGDRSGTHLKELELWRRAGIAPKGPWYLESGAGMAQTLVLAAEKGAYTLTDLATFLTVGKKRGLKALYRRETPFSATDTATTWCREAPRRRRPRPCAASWPRRRPPASLRACRWREPPFSRPSGGGVSSPQVEAAELWEIALRSLWVAGAATLLAALPAVPLGLWLALRGGGGILGRVLLYAGLALPSVVVGLLFYLLLSRSGPLGSLDLLYTPYAMVLAEAVLAFPLIAAFVLSGARGRVEEVRLLVRSLGGREAQVLPTLFWESRRTLAAALAAGFGGAISEVGAATLVGGDIRHQTRVLTTAIVVETRKGELEAALALGGVLLGLALLVTALLVILERE
jgi:tungstate transport system permease protein